MHDLRPPAAQSYLAAIVASSDDAILSKNLDGIIQSCNASAERMFGYRADELVGRPVRMLIPPARQAEEDLILDRIRRGERIDHFETVRLTKDGREIDVSVTVSPVRNEAGVIVGASKIVRDIGDRKRAGALQAHLAAIIESSEDAILSKNLDGIIQSCNARAEQLFGYSAAELVGRSVRTLIPPERQSEEDDILARMRRGERLQHFETVRVAKDGRRLDISLSVSPIRDPSGAIIGVAKIVRDITEQKRIAARLAAEQEWFRVTLSSIGDAVIASDAYGRVTYMNAPAEALCGWMLPDAAGRPLADVFHIVNEQSRQVVENPAERVMRSGHTIGLANHTLLIARDGTERPIADSAAPIREADGTMAGVVLVFRDVTDERRAEQALAEQREWFETTLESIGDAVIATDADGRVAFMNRIAQALTGWTIERARGQACADVFRIVNEQTRLTVDDPVKRVLTEGTIVGLANHTVLIAADGTERPIDDSGAPIRGGDGRIIGAVLVFRDVSDRHRIEMERRSTGAERERLLEAERSARAEAERANRLKDEFVAMVSHELRTPLNAILGWTQLMTKGMADPAVMARGLDVVARNTRVQAQLISDLLDISRIVSGKLRLDIDTVDLASIIRDAIETVEAEARQKNVRIACDLDPAVGSIVGDPARLQQIVWNLLSNAIKFTPDGGRIDVRLGHAGPDVVLTITDTGVGIPPAFLPHIFDRFQQADRSITRRFGGLGLGLSIVKHLVDLHGGTVAAASAGEGQGSTFTIVLDRRRQLRATDTAAGGDVTGDTGSAPAEESLSLRGVRVLVVEDEPDTRDFLGRFLTMYGAEVVAAGSAMEALTLLPAGAFDLLVSDIGLPEIDGYDLIQRVRELDAQSGGGIPAIALTAYARREDRERALGAGYHAHLAKPVEPAELIAMVARLVARS